MTYAAFAASATNNPHGEDLSIDCITCHSMENWEQLRADLQFEHATSRFPLEGRHKSVSCKACHTNLVFSGTDDRCFSCHLDIHENQFGDNCERCHNPDRWIDETRFRLSHSETQYPLTGVHASLDCRECHEAGRYINLPLTCDGCHYDAYTGTNNPNHLVAGFSLDCTTCHRDNRSGWSPAEYNHLGIYECFVCHEPDYLNVRDPNHSGSDFPKECETCHTIHSWEDATFDHNLSSFQLEGAHIQLQCSDCHQEIYTGTPSKCYGCHESDYSGIADPDHVAGQYDFVCTLCHSMDGWLPANIDHNETDFPLTGSHITVDCNDCHSTGYNNTSTDCYPCHDDDFEGVVDPNHVTGDYSFDCILCHDNLSEAWSPALFDHSVTAFLIDGAHVSLGCIDCHEQGYNDTPPECVGCHRDDFGQVSEPDHTAEQFSYDCTICHSTSTWSPSTFDHNLTNFQLDGAHLSLNCLDCHSEGYASMAYDCFSCHRPDYENVEIPIHTEGTFDHDCLECHTTDGWTPSSFEHNNDTEYELTGSHLTTDCSACHIDGVYNGTSTDCYGCHEPDYRNAGDPDHAAADYPLDCGVCHSTVGWSPAEINHDLTEFPLTGAHVNVDCADCHTQGYTGTPTDCYSCHNDDYESVTDPDHQDGNYDHDCSICHTTDGWTPAAFDHDQSDFPLTGAHLQLECNDCHSQGYTGTPVACYGCHQDDFEDVNDPNHVTGQFEHDCTICHTTEAWSPATFDHDETEFPLTGSHRTVNCGECHIDGQYEGTPTGCYFCHDDDYNDADDPDHRGAGFPTDCEQCHNTTDWGDADFNHRLWFPIYTGNHREEWDRCSDCHTNPNDYSVFYCIDCHEHNREDTDDDHDEVQGYVYNSDACYECHPDGEGDDLLRPLIKHIDQNRRKID
ncbi:MAG: hypothetical protein P9L92_15640 [Candidatus Electryonea clarkiae]|nr:hypothetical protein [Candidatus Electryonea clarkiae]